MPPGALAAATLDSSVLPQPSLLVLSYCMTQSCLEKCISGLCQVMVRVPVRKEGIQWRLGPSWQNSVDKYLLAQPG